MKLHELGARRPTEQAAMMLESHAGQRIDFAAIGPRRAQGMLSQLQTLLREHRSSSDFHHSQQDSAYLQLVVMEQALVARMQEQAPVMSTDPKAKAVMDKVNRGQDLTPDEQQTVNKIAVTKEGKRKKPMVREQNELQQAQVVLAAQDMIDRLQGMLEDISEMQFKDLPALTDSIKNDMGVQQATQFQTQAGAVLTTLLSAVQDGKIEMEAAQGVLTGQGSQVPGMDMDMDAMPAADPNSGEDELDLSLDANLPGGEEEEEEEEITAPLGRERR